MNTCQIFTASFFAKSRNQEILIISKVCSTQIKIKVSLMLQLNAIRLNNTNSALNVIGTWPLIAIQTHASVIQMLKVVGRNLRRRLAEGALKPAAAVYELHER